MQHNLFFVRCGITSSLQVRRLQQSVKRKDLRPGPAARRQETDSHTGRRCAQQWIKISVRLGRALCDVTGGSPFGFLAAEYPSESPVVMPREGGVSSIPGAMGVCPHRNHVVTGSPAFAGDDMLFDAIIPGQILSLAVQDSASKRHFKTCEARSLGSCMLKPACSGVLRAERL